MRNGGEHIECPIIRHALRGECEGRLKRGECEGRLERGGWTEGKLGTINVIELYLGVFD